MKRSCTCLLLILGLALGSSQCTPMAQTPEAKEPTVKALPRRYDPERVVVHENWPFGENEAVRRRQEASRRVGVLLSGRLR